MANNITDAQYRKMVSALKSEPGLSAPKVADAAGIAVSDAYKNLFQAELEADPSLKIKATEAGIRDAVNSGELRWPRLAVYAGISVTEAKQLYKKATGKNPPSNLTARGRQYDGSTPVKRGTAKRGGAPRGQSGRRGAAAKKSGAAAASTGTSGRRGAKSGGAAPAGQKRGRGKRGTRSSANPR